MTRRASKPRVIGLPQAANIIEEIIEVVDPEIPGRMTMRKQGRRADNVFESLYVSGRINDEERTAINEMVETYAKSKGLIGVGERNMERVQNETSDLHAAAMARARHAIKYNEIMARLDQEHERLLTALIRDFVMGDGAGLLIDDGVRWRAVVRASAGYAVRKSYEANPVVRAIAPLPSAIINYRKMIARNKQERMAISPVAREVSFPPSL